MWILFCIFTNSNEVIAFMNRKLIFKKGLYGLGICFFLLFNACESSNSVEPDADRMILFYLAADNGLDFYLKKNIEDILEGMEGVNGRVVIYMDARNHVPVLMTIKRQGNRCVLDTIERYEEENSASPRVLRRVANRVRELYPSSSYGLVLGSHASGWIPTGIQFPQTKAMARRLGSVPMTRFFGEDGNQADDWEEGNGINVEDFVKGLPDGYEFILFDACLMGSIEIMYALRHKAKYVVASAPEILVDGFPYMEVMPLLWGNEEDLKEVCRRYRDYYENHSSDETWKSGVIALVRTAYLDTLALQCREILNGKMEEIEVMASSEIWRYPLIDYAWDVFFDFDSYIRRWASESQYAAFKSCLDLAVYDLSTTTFNGQPIPEECCGISTYIPLKQWATANDEYYNLDWAKYVYGK